MRLLALHDLQNTNKSNQDIQTLTSLAEMSNWKMLRVLDLRKSFLQTSYQNHFGVVNHKL